MERETDRGDLGNSILELLGMSGIVMTSNTTTIFVSTLNCYLCVAIEVTIYIYVITNSN